jgi:hypothetical protein
MAVKRTRVVSKDNNQRTVTTTKRSGATVTRTKSKTKEGGVKTVSRNRKASNVTGGTESSKTRTKTKGRATANLPTMAAGDRIREKKTTQSYTVGPAGGRTTMTASKSKTRKSTGNNVTKSKNVGARTYQEGKQIDSYGYLGKLGKKMVTGNVTKSTSRQRKNK